MKAVKICIKELSILEQKYLQYQKVPLFSKKNKSRQACQAKKISFIVSF